jgi:hypothetical protein
MTSNERLNRIAQSNVIAPASSPLKSDISFLLGEIEQLRGERGKIMADVSAAMRIMYRAVSWIEIQLAAIPSHKGQSIVDEMHAWMSGKQPVESASTYIPPTDELISAVQEEKTGEKA